ncbi:hypothetical protein GEMRC1_009041 [Eukaryota sp. GEM-RC1]
MNLKHQHSKDLLIVYDRQGDWSNSGSRFGRYLNFRVFYDAPSKLSYCYHHIGCNFQFANSPYTIDFDAVRQQNLDSSYIGLYEFTYPSGHIRTDYHYGTSVKQSVRVGDHVIFLHAFAFNYNYQSAPLVTQYHSRLIAGIATITGFNYRGIPNSAATSWNLFYNHGWTQHSACPPAVGDSIRCTGAFRGLAIATRDINNDGKDDVLFFTLYSNVLVLTIVTDAETNIVKDTVPSVIVSSAHTQLGEVCSFDNCNMVVALQDLNSNGKLDVTFCGRSSGSSRLRCIIGIGLKSYAKLQPQHNKMTDSLLTDIMVLLSLMISSLVISPSLLPGDQSVLQLIYKRIIN